MRSDARTGFRWRRARGRGRGARGHRGAIVSPFNGDVVGISVRGSAVCTAGSATFSPSFNGAVQTLSAVINATDATWDYATQDAGEDTFTAGTGLSVEVTTTSGFLPTGSTEYFAVLYILFRR